MKKTLAILEGDGIGPEIVAEAMKVLHAIEQKFDHSFTLNYAPFGASAYFSQGSPFPAETIKICDEADVIIKGPVGLAVDKMNEIPRECRPELGAIFPLRKRFNTFANFRPIRLTRELFAFSPLKEDVLKEDLDILMIRELVGGIYFGDKIEGSQTDMMYAKDESAYTREEVEQVTVVAFEEARKHPAKQLINIHKSNALATSRFWNEIVERLAKDYADVEYRSMLVDNAAFQLVVNPSQFNGVVLLENMQGDIITDQAGGVLGSLGLMPSACIGPEKSYVEPAHGSAPDIAGQNIANPYSMIGSIALMFEKCLDAPAEARIIWDALFAVFRNGYVTVELAKPDFDKEKVLSCSQFGDMVVDYIQNNVN